MKYGRNEGSRIDWKFVIIVFFIALLFRIIWAFTLDPNKFYFPDSEQWNQIAVNFLEGKGLIVSENAKALRPPLYPLFLYIVYFLSGKTNLLLVRIIQAILSSLTCFTIYLIATNTFNQKVGKIAMLISAFYPFFIYYSGAILSETLFVFVLSSLMLLLIYKKFFSAGIIFGIATLTRSEIIFFLLFAIITIFITSKIREALKNSITIIVLTSLIMSPWVIRNYLIFNKFIPFTTMGGYTFYEGNNSKNLTGGPCGPCVSFVYKKEMGEIERDEYLKSRAINEIKNNPKRIVRLTGKKILRFWNIKLNTDDPRYASKLTNLASMLSFGPILFLFIIGLVLSLWNRKKLIYFYFLILHAMLVNLAFVSSLRYRLPSELFMIIIASYTLSLILLYSPLKKGELKGDS